MLEQFFKEARALERARTSASGPYLDGFIGSLQAVGYGERSILDLTRTAVHLGLWMERRRISLREVDDASIERFRIHLRTCRCPGPRPRRRRDRKISTWAATFVRYLRQEGLVPQAAPSGVALPRHIAKFEAWMRQHRGVTPTTLEIYRRILIDALSALGSDPRKYDARGVREFVLDRSKRHGRSKAKLVMTAMRAFLRYLVASGVCHPGLDGAVPTIAGWRLAALPRPLSSAEVERVIATCNASSARGARDRAMLLLMARLGLRAGDIAGLQLDDIDWDQATLAVSGKSRSAMRLPITQEVGDAILAYLPLRPAGDLTRRIFLCVVPPWRPITSGAITSIAGRAIRAAGIVAPVRGGHLLRHSAASDLLRQGASLDQVRVVLRHRDPETTRLYAKIDLALLRGIAQAWPGVTPC